MAEAIALTERFDRALLYATHVHGGQTRKATTVPYLAHLLAVAATVLEYNGDEEQAIAALLHDAVEDQGGAPRLADIRNRFGDRVARIVAACSDNLQSAEDDDEKAEWRVRKERYLASLADKPADTLLVTLADKVHNARSILRDLHKADIGHAVWQRFNKPPEETLWYYDSLAIAFQAHLPGQLADELGEIAQAMRAELDD